MTVNIKYFLQVSIEIKFIMDEVGSGGIHCCRLYLNRLVLLLLYTLTIVIHLFTASISLSYILYFQFNKVARLPSLSIISTTILS